MPTRVRYSAFTLLELMLVITIIGILAVIAIPGYTNYVIRSKTAEAYQGMDLLTKKEITFFNEFGEFNAIAVSNPGNLSPTMVIETSAQWEGWYPAPVGSRVHFSYFSGAGKTNAAGTEILLSSVNGNVMVPVANPHNFIRRIISGSGVRCNSNVSAVSLGAVAQSNYDWVIVAATGDLNNDGSTNCTSIARLTEASATTDRKPSSRGYIVMNLGD